MSLDDDLRRIVREEIQAALRDELAALLRPPEEFITAQQAASLFGIHEKTIKAMIRSGRLKAYGTSSRNLRVARVEVVAAMEQRGAANDDESWVRQMRAKRSG